MSTDNLDDLLSDTQAPEATPAAQPEPVVTAPEPKGERAAPPAASQEKDDDRAVVPRAALEDERRKRQEYERKVREYEDWYQRQVAAQQQPKQPEMPDPYVDPNAAFQWQQDQMKREMQAHAQRYEQELFNTRLFLSEARAKEKFSDYDDTIAVFIEVAQNNPNLANAVRAHPTPALQAYEIGRKARLYRDIGDDPEAYERKLREKWEAERNGNPNPAPSANPAAARAPVPRSLASTTSAKVNRDPTSGQFASRASLEDLIG